MEIKRLGENRIRCALTEAEIQKMGFEIDDIIGNSEITQKFMRVVLGLVEEQENLSIENISPMVKAELLQDHSMAITFGGDSDVTFKDLVDTINHLVGQMHPEKISEFQRMSGDEKQRTVDQFLQKYNAKEETPQGGEKRMKKVKPEPMTCALRFLSMDDLIGMSRVCFPGKVPESSLYKMEDVYYLVIDFTEFSKDEMRPFAFGTVEYDAGHFSEASQIAHIREKGDCIIESKALQMLMQL